MIRFAVFDEDVGIADDFIGQFSIPFTSLRPGYRHIHLLGNKGESLGYATLFVNIEINSSGSNSNTSSPMETASPTISRFQMMITHLARNFFIFFADSSPVACLPLGKRAGSALMLVSREKIRDDQGRVSLLCFLLPESLVNLYYKGNKLLTCIVTSGSLFS